MPEVPRLFCAIAPASGGYGPSRDKPRTSAAVRRMTGPRAVVIAIDQPGIAGKMRNDTPISTWE
jgi:hypothetical protein